MPHVHAQHRRKWPAYLLGLALVLALRLIPFRPPNVEPITATLLPFSRSFGAVGGALFGLLSIVAYDALTAGIGEWTVVVGISYALLGAASAAALRSDRVTPLRYLAVAVVATLLFDAVTGVLYSWLRFDMPLWQSFVGQIPFTLNHLAGNAVLALVLSPMVERFLTENTALALLHPVRTSTS